MIFNSEEIVWSIKKKIDNPEGKWRYVKSELELFAEERFEGDILSVTDYVSPAVSGNPHDYYSEGPYWWPNPEDPDGEYIWRDGRINPERFDKHTKAFGKLADRISVLAYAGFYLERPEWSKRALKLLNAWFVDEKTKMNPHLEYAQAIRRKCTGRGIGIIDFINLIAIINACCVMELSEELKDSFSGFKKWLEEFLDWLLNSKNGHDEKYNGNNHSTWYAALVMTIAAYLEKSDVIKEYVEFFKTDLIIKQSDASGAFPSELKRTKSFTYSIFNLDAAAIVCEVAYKYGIDLWHYECDGKGMKKSIEYLVPFMLNPYEWEYEQCNGLIPDTSFAFESAGFRLGMTEAWDAIDFRGKKMLYLRYWQPLGYFPLLFGRLTEE